MPTDLSPAPRPDAAADWPDPPFRVEAPAEWTAPLVFASPHSGNVYPASFRAASRLDALRLRGSEDAFVDEIFAAAPALGAPLLCALFPRAFVDPNREPFELDPAMFRAPLPGHVNTTSPRVLAGLGTVARVITSGEEIYHAPLDFEDAEARIDRLYTPYHRALSGLIDDARRHFGACLLVDCHSMPSIGGPMDRDPGLGRVDMVLGDCHGTSCAPAVTDFAERTLKGMGYVVTRNAPYAGGHTTRHYGRPADDAHAIQIEINRRLYMDETSVTRGEGITRLTEDITAFIGEMVRAVPGFILQEPGERRRAR